MEKQVGYKEGIKQGNEEKIWKAGEGKLNAVKVKICTEK